MLPLLAVVLAVLERVPALRFRQARVLRPSVATDVLYLLTGFVAGGSLAAAWVRGASGWLDARAGLGTRVWGEVPFPLQVLLALVALDLGNYGVHWLLHRSDALWEFHKVHHSSVHLDWLATFRSHAVEQALRRALAPLVLIAAGVPPAAVGMSAIAFFGWAMLNHANLRLPLGALEPILVTPRLHRLHHVPATTERNLGTVLTCWDRLRGTLVVADTPAAAVLGFGQASYPQDWGRQLVAPVVALRARLRRRGRRGRGPSAS